MNKAKKVGSKAWGYRHVILVAIWLLYIFNYFDRTSVLVFLPLIREDIGISVQQAGFAASVFFLIYAAGQVTGGWLADKIGAKKVMMFAIVVFTLITFITGRIQNLTQFILARIFLGIGEGHHFSPAQRTIAEWFPRNEKGFATSFFATSWSVGPAITPILVTALAAALGGWRPVFYLLAIPGVIGILILAFCVFNTPEEVLEKCKLSQEEYDYIKAGIAESDNVEQVGFGVVARDKYYWAYAGVNFCTQCIYWGTTTWLSSYLVDQHHFSLAKMGALVSLPFIVAILAMLVGGQLVDKVFHRVRPVMLISFLVSMPVLMYFGIAPTNTGLLIVLLILVGFFTNLIWGAMHSFPQLRYPKECIGSAVGVANGIGYVGAFLSPFIASYLVVPTATGYSYTGAYIMFGVIALLGAVFAFLLNEDKYDYKKTA